MRKILLITTFVCLTSTVYAESTPYVGMDFGGIELSNGTRYMFNPLAGPTGFNGRVMAGNLWGEAQGFQYGLEGDLMYFPDASLDFFGLDQDVKGYAVSLLGVTKYVFNSGFDLIGKAGVAYLYQKNKDNFNDGDTSYAISSASGYKIAPELALGVGYQFNPNWEMTLVADSIFAGRPNDQNSTNPVSQTNTFNLGLAYHFA